MDGVGFPRSVRGRLAALGSSPADSSGNDGRAIDHQLGNPPSSQSRSSCSTAEGLGPRRLAQRSPIAPSSRAKTSASRRCISRAERSRSATVIAPVMVSPVNCASSRASRQVLAFLILRLTMKPPVLVQPHGIVRSSAKPMDGTWLGKGRADPKPLQAKSDANRSVGSSYSGRIFPEILAHPERSPQKGWEDVS